MKTQRAVLRGLGLICYLGIISPLYALAMGLLPTRWHPHLRQRCYRLGTRIAGIRNIHIQGAAIPQSPVILMANHISHMDILVLGSMLPYIFVSKDEVRRWPILGWTAARFGTLFISRKITDVKTGLDRVTQALGQNTALILFPEGTTSDGCRVLPFKTSYFHLPEEIYIQPVTLKYTAFNGLPALRFYQKQFSWRGNVDLITHLWHVLKIRRVCAHIIVHPPLQRTGHRKDLAHHCHHAVQQGFELL